MFQWGSDPKPKLGIPSVWMVKKEKPKGYPMLWGPPVLLRDSDPLLRGIPNFVLDAK